MSRIEDGKAIVEDRILQPGQPWGRRLIKGECVRFVDLQGQQAVDFLCYDAVDPADRYNAGNTIKMQSNLFLNAGSSLWSDDGHKLMTITKSTSGFHDTIAGCCSSRTNIERYGDPGPGNCRDTFEVALKQFGLGRGDIVANINWFMHVPVQADGSTAISEGLSRPGDFVELIAERDVICVASNCTQVYNCCNGFNPTPVQILVYRAGE